MQENFTNASKNNEEKNSLMIIKKKSLKELPTKNILIKLLKWQNEILANYSSKINDFYVVPLVKHSTRPPIKSLIKSCTNGSVQKNELNNDLSKRDNQFKAKIKGNYKLKSHSFIISIVELTLDLSQSTEFYIPVQKQRWMSVGELSVLHRIKILAQMIGSFSSMKDFQLSIIEKYYDQLVSKKDSNITTLVKNYLKGLWSCVLIPDIFSLDMINYASIDKEIIKYLPESLFKQRKNSTMRNQPVQINYNNPTEYVRELEVQINCLRTIVHLVIKPMIDLSDQSYCLSNDSKKILQSFLMLKKIYSNLPNKYYFLETHPLYKTYIELLNESPDNNGIIFKQ
uniref:Ras-GEF domain-containing protein n=1 Tax=Strongyloides venezuelensis TaxID=75913 RepID=A0A0K0FYA4_STRVS